ncbi:hyaluronoglucosaminidase [Clostridium cavendishii DSM 21758]|uniref:Hyaluronoglucosaminidase n=1 Tax=Clostridium cavendishii DSM 21758 TaxID=1121302 RepID=A0A1M6MVG0_9CLOT|nr:beta-N-acetylglucosaminidase domain-containing protein [Clostridium cavendishii]SHJ87485.1 hyaluronoglucosaminidase [Clostridium cavendishii DSM 21758]
MISSDTKYLLNEIYYNGEEKIINKEKITINFINRFSMHQEIVCDIENDLVEVVKEKEADINLTYFYKNDLKDDGYEIIIDFEDIKIYSRNLRGLRFAQKLLEKLIILQDGEIIVPIVHIKDEPTFNIRGIIEGFYGKPWSFKDRFKAVDFLIENRMNTYMYAPKDDKYHRELWREEYPQDMYEEIKKLKKYSDNNLIDFYYCLSPGNDIDVTLKEDIDSVLRKIKAMLDIGVKDFALLMDDIDYSLNENHKIKFRRVGQVHSYICNEVYKFLKENILDFNLIMCPTEYWQNYDTEYRKDINENLVDEIKVFWTGYATIAENIKEEDVKLINESINREIVLWDNIPVNDMEKDRGNLFLSPVQNRSIHMQDYNHIGIVANPMPQFNMSKLTLITYSHFMWNPERYNENLSLDIASRDIGGEFYLGIKAFSELNANYLLRKTYTTSLKKAVNGKKFDILNKYFEDLELAINSIMNLDDYDMLEEVAPWIDRAKRDITVYKYIVQNSHLYEKDNFVHGMFKKYFEELNSCNIKIGDNIIVKLLETYY